jgi:hypothetical protein
MRRHRRMSTAGIIVIRVSPGQLHAEPDQILHDIASALAQARPAAKITTRPAP